MNSWKTIVSSTLSDQMFHPVQMMKVKIFKKVKKFLKWLSDLCGLSAWQCQVQNVIDKLLINYDIGKSIDHNHDHKPSILDSD